MDSKTLITVLSEYSAPPTDNGRTELAKPMLNFEDPYYLEGCPATPAWAGAPARWWAAT
jgi:hypothetical protein